MTSSLILEDALIGRRQALALLGSAGIASFTPGTTAGTATADGLDFRNPIDNLYAFGKIWAGYDAPVIGAFHGLMYLKLPGKRLLPVFGYTGTGVLLAEFDPKGFLRIKSRETGYFTDLRTGEILEHWDNPITGERCEVYHFYNDLIAGTLTTEVPKFMYGAAGDSPTVMNDGTVFPDADGRYPFRLPFSRFGDDLMLEWDYAHEYTNPVTPAGWPSYSTGAKITPSEHFTMFASLAEVQDKTRGTARMRAGFSRLSECWPWMRMGKAPPELRGITLFGRMHSHKGLSGLAEIPKQLLAYIEKNAPDSLTLPAEWQSKNKRVETWGAFAMDVPPETAGYEWAGRDQRPSGFVGPPTGLGRLGYR